NLISVRVELTSSTVAGGDILIQVHDTLDIFNDVVDNALGYSEQYTLTEADVAAGFVNISLVDPLTLDPNAYYVSAALFSNGNQNDIRILDDLTVPQPGGASLIYLPSDGVVYGNGNAFAIQLNFDPTSSVEESAVAELEGVNIYPNPVANGIITIATNQRENFSVEVFDSVGALVESKRFNMNTTVDVSALAKGVYTVRVNSANASTTQLVTVQ
ncbi:MAG: T9SS type A sorting domain-containing protein, partial [Flavobacteriales bacterium]